MKVSASIEEVRQQVITWQRQGKKVAFVPTMGNLHLGHVTLVRKGLELADHVVTSIYVNPLQFGANEDLQSYPSTPEEDKRWLEKEGCSLLFLPNDAIVYPQGRSQVTQVTVPGLSEHWCGESRPGHFGGVLTVVCKLFNIVPADYAVFGQKDFQQLAVIRKMVNDLNFPIQIVGVDTVREPNGLAMSSRNQYLTDDERRRAVTLYQVLTQTRAKITSGQRNYAMLEDEAGAILTKAGFVPDYFAVCRQHDLLPASGEDRSLVVLAAAKMGNARLIDNITIDIQDIHNQIR